MLDEVIIADLPELVLNMDWDDEIILQDDHELPITGVNTGTVNEHLVDIPILEEQNQLPQILNWNDQIILKDDLELPITGLNPGTVNENLVEIPMLEENTKPPTRHVFMDEGELNDVAKQRLSINTEHQTKWAVCLLRVLNISTSAQLAFQMAEDFVPPQLDVTSAIEYFPYFSGRYLAVAASLTGGNVMAAFVRMLQQWTHELGLGVPESKIWDKVLSLGLESPDTDMVVTPTIFGERHNPSERASVTNITSLNTTLGSVYKALCKGVITNLHKMMSQDCLLAAGIHRIVGSGTAIMRNQILREEIQDQYKLPLVLCEDSLTADAAVGAAMALLD